MAARRSSPTDYDSFEVGDQVRHSKWGVGSILFKSGSGETAKAIVVFPEQGQKKLLLKYAKLERVQETPEAEEDEFGVAEEAVVVAKAPAPKTPRSKEPKGEEEKGEEKEDEDLNDPEDEEEDEEDEEEEEE